MTVSCKIDKATATTTLHLSWIPNTTLRKYPGTLEKAAAKRLDTAKELEPQVEEPGQPLGTLLIRAVHTGFSIFHSIIEAYETCALRALVVLLLIL
jgi:hypothetical protein